MASISLPTAAAIAGGVGAATSAVGSITAAQGQAAQIEAAGNAASYQAQVAQNNATIANQNAQYASAAAEQQATNQNLASRAKLGSIVAGEAANNIDVNTGSAKDVQTSQRELGQTDVLTTLNNSLLNVYSYQAQATSEEATAGLENLEAEEAPSAAANAETAGFLSGAGSLLSNASALGFKWIQAGNPSSSTAANINNVA